MSPTAAVILLGEYARVPFEFPTFTTCTVTAPVDFVDEPLLVMVEPFTLLLELDEDCALRCQ